MTFNATPSAVYEAFMDSKTHSKFTNSKCVLSTKVGGKFVCGDGYMTGKNLELVKGKKIVQTWAAQGWPAGHESKITLNLKKVASGTQLHFFHSHVPDKAVKSITEGWKSFYWEPMKKMFTK